MWWVIVAAAALGPLWFVNGLVVQANEAQQAWGETRSVFVATAVVEVGEGVHGAVESQVLPVVAVPDGAVEIVGVDVVARERIHPGEVIVGARVSGSGVGLAERLPEGTSAIAVPSGPGWPPLAIGDVVDLHATLNELVGGQPETLRVAERAVVVDVGERAVTVAVPRTQVSATANALSRGVITVALVG